MGQRRRHTNSRVDVATLGIRPKSKDPFLRLSTRVTPLASRDALITQKNRGSRPDLVLRAMTNSGIRESSWTHVCTVRATVMPWSAIDDWLILFFPRTVMYSYGFLWWRNFGRTDDYVVRSFVHAHRAVGVKYSKYQEDRVLCCWKLLGVIQKNISTSLRS